MSWKPEVQVDGAWSGNGMAFASEIEAFEWASDLLLRWTAPTRARAVRSDETPNYAYSHGEIRRLPDAQAAQQMPRAS